MEQITDGYKFIFMSSRLGDTIKRISNCLPQNQIIKYLTLRDLLISDTIEDGLYLNKYITKTLIRRKKRILYKTWD